MLKAIQWKIYCIQTIQHLSLSFHPFIYLDLCGSEDATVKLNSQKPNKNNCGYFTWGQHAKRKAKQNQKKHSHTHKQTSTAHTAICDHLNVEHKVYTHIYVALMCRSNNKSDHCGFW